MPRSTPVVTEALPPGLEPLLAGFRQGKRLALARAITLVENEREGFQAFLHAVLESSAQGRRLGITGPPGAGKSTLVSRLCEHYRSQDEEVGVVAVDPSSPFSGGALLGDRIRMNDLATDPGVFIRSMATRGSLGGLATTTHEVADLMDAFGFPRVLVETVGVGQTELDITRAADTVVVVLVPESGDGVQAMKAGLMEIADIFVVNKADRPGAEPLLKELRTALHLRAGAEDEGRWPIPVLATRAHQGEGVAELAAAVRDHREWLEETGELGIRRRRRAESRVRDVVTRALALLARDAVQGERLEAALDRIGEGTDTPYSAAAEFVERILGENARARESS